MSVTETLDLFVQRARELEQTRLIKSKASATWSMQLTHEGVTAFTTMEPEEEDLRSFLLTFRQFVSADEPVFLFRIHNLLYPRLADDELKGHLAAAREAIKSAGRGNGIHVIHNDVEVSPERLADLWINGVYFHNDRSKRRELEAYLSFPPLMAKHQFIWFVLGVTKVIFLIASLIEYARAEGLIQET